jgi:predicted TIM-barrel fold metal-dependent hydrolase
LFGAERCSFEGNFLGTGYATLWNAFKRITAGFSPTEKLALYSGTAKRLYRLD